MAEELEVSTGDDDGSMNAAVSAIQKKMADAGKQQEQRSDGADTVTAADEQQDQPAQESEGPGEPETAIAAPSSWSEADKAAFARLPPETQEIVARRESERERAFQQKTSEIAAERKKAEAEAQQAAQERQQLSAALRSYTNPLWAAFTRDFPEAAKGVQIDPVRLAETDVLRFQKFQAYQIEFGRIQQAERVLAERAAQEQLQALEKFREDENAKLRTDIPELKSDKAWSAFEAEITDYVQSYGIGVDRLRTADAAMLKIARKAMLWDKAQEARQQGKIPVTGHVREAPKVIKPGTGVAGAQSGAEAVAARQQQLRKTGSLADATKLIEARMAPRRRA